MSFRARIVVPTILSRRASTYGGDATKWQTINRLASEGKWDNVNNCPKLFLYGDAKKETHAAFNAINHKTDFWSQSPYGMYMKLAWRIALLLGIIKAGVVAYEFIVPEEKRLHYKYRNHGHH